MNPKRQKVQDFIISSLDRIVENGPNKAFFTEHFNKMSDEEFHQFMLDLQQNKTHLVVIWPNYTNAKVHVETLFEMAEELGHNFMEKLYIGPTETAPKYLTPIEFMILKMPIRRNSQLLDKKMGVDKHSTATDLLTGQVSGKEAKGSKISLPEMRIMSSMGLDDCLNEFLNVRGGDRKAYLAMAAMLQKYGGASQEAIKQFSGSVISKRTLKTYLTCMHLGSNL